MIPNLRLNTVKPNTEVLHSPQIHPLNKILIPRPGLIQTPSQRDMKTIRVIPTLTVVIMVMCNLRTGGTGLTRGRRIKRRLIELRQGAITQFQETVESVVLGFCDVQHEEPACFFVVGDPF